jgi:hypothetical protein
MKVALEPDQGFRTRNLPAAQARDFVEKYLGLARSFEQEAVNSERGEATEQVPEAEAEGSLTGTGSLDAAVKVLLDKALREQEERLTAKFLELLKGIPGYNRPVMLHTPEPIRTKEKPVYTVVVVNAIRAQVESVQRAFPSIDIRAVNDRLPAEQDPDLVVSLVRFIDHPLDRSLRKKYGSRYVPVNGASESVKAAIRQRLNLEKTQ